MRKKKKDDEEEGEEDEDENSKAVRKTEAKYNSSDKRKRKTVFSLMKSKNATAILRKTRRQSPLPSVTCGLRKPRANVWLTTPSTTNMAAS